MAGDPDRLAVFAHRLRQVREECQLSAAQLAVAVGLKSEKTVHLWQAGTGYPTVATLIRVAELLGVTTDWLLGLAGEEDEDG